MATKELMIDALVDNLPEVQAYVDEQLEIADCSMKAQSQPGSGRCF